MRPRGAHTFSNALLLQQLLLLLGTLLLLLPSYHWARSLELLEKPAFPGLLTALGPLQQVAPLMAVPEALPEAALPADLNFRIPHSATSQPPVRCWVSHPTVSVDAYALERMSAVTVERSCILSPSLYIEVAQDPSP